MAGLLRDQDAETELWGDRRDPIVEVKWKSYRADGGKWGFEPCDYRAHPSVFLDRLADQLRVQITTQYVVNRQSYEWLQHKRHFTTPELTVHKDFSENIDIDVRQRKGKSNRKRIG